MTGAITGALETSPFHDFWASRSLVNGWGRCGRLSVPLELFGYAEEVGALGVGAGFSDISSRAITKILGPDMAVFLAAVTGARDDAFAPGSVRSVLWCDSHGFVRGAGRVAIRSRTEAILVSAVSDGRWFARAAAPFDVRLEPVLAAGLRVAGPLAAGIFGPDRLRETVEIEMAGIGPVLAFPLARGGVDVWCQPEQALSLAWALENSGARPVGAKSMRAWGVATGLLTAGVDWIPAQWAVLATDRRTRSHLTDGGYVVVGWSGSPPADVRHAIHWPALGLDVALLWLPPVAGRLQTPPGGGTILCPAATD